MGNNLILEEMGIYMEENRIWEESGKFVKC